LGVIAGEQNYPPWEIQFQAGEDAVIRQR